MALTKWGAEITWGELMAKARRVLVTGHRGYLGGCVAERLVHHGLEVHGLDAGLVPTGLLRPVAPVALEHIADIRDVSAEVFEGVEAVIHLAALSNDQMGDLDPVVTEDINHRGAVRIARLARERGVARFVFASSCSVYGASDGSLLTEDSALRPVTTYARAKAAAEIGILSLADGGFTPVAVRFATLFGPAAALRTDLVVNRLTVVGDAQGTVTLDSDGRSWRPFVHVEDAADTMVAVLDAARDEITGQAFNVVGRAGNFQMADVARLIGSAVPDSMTILDDAQPADARSYRVSGRRLARATGVVPERSLHDGVRGLLALIAQSRATFDDLVGKDHVRLLGLRALLAEGRVGADLRRVRSRV